MKNSNPYTGKPNSSSVLSGSVDSTMLKRSSSSSHVNSQLKSLFVSSSSNPSHHNKTVISNDSSSGYLSSIKFAQDAEASYSYQEVSNKAKSIDEEIKIITNSILKIGEHRVNVFNAGNDLCKKMSQHYLHEAEYNNCAYQKSRDEWKAKGNYYLASNIYDIMKENGILPSWGNQYLTLQSQVLDVQVQNNVPQVEENNQEEEMMKAQFEELKAQLNLLILEKEQKDNALAEKDNALAEKDGIILQLQTENHDLSDKLVTSEKNNVVLQEKLVTSEEKICLLQENLQGLKIENKELKEDKIELREDKKMLVDDKKMLQEEKKLLLLDKKHFQDLSLEQATKITQLSQIHCNNPDHFEMIGLGMTNDNLNDL